MEFTLQTKLIFIALYDFRHRLSVKEELTIAVLMRFLTTPKDPITAHVNLDMKGTEIIAQVIFFGV